MVANVLEKQKKWIVFDNLNYHEVELIGAVGQDEKTGFVSFAYIDTDDYGFYILQPGEVVLDTEEAAKEYVSREINRINLLQPSIKKALNTIHRADDDCDEDERIFNHEDFLGDFAYDIKAGDHPYVFDIDYMARCIKSGNIRIGHAYIPMEKVLYVELLPCYPQKVEVHLIDSTVLETTDETEVYCLKKIYNS